jgi:hypothetical protein
VARRASSRAHRRRAASHVTIAEEHGFYWRITSARPAEHERWSGWPPEESLTTTRSAVLTLTSGESPRLAPQGHPWKDFAHPPPQRSLRPSWKGTGGHRSRSSGEQFRLPGALVPSSLPLSQEKAPASAEPGAQPLLPPVSAAKRRKRSRRLLMKIEGPHALPESGALIASARGSRITGRGATTGKHKGRRPTPRAIRTISTR